MKPSNDYEAILLILEGLVAKGHRIDGFIDDTWNKEDVTYTDSPRTATEGMCGVDEGFVLMTDKEGKSGYIYFVLGNSPEEVACDYTVNLDPDLSNITNPWWE